MHNLQKRWNKFISVLRSIMHGKTSGQWSFLFVKENGEIISINRFKELVITLVTVVAIMAITVTVFAVLYKSEKGKTDQLKKALNISEQKITALQEEKDVLMVRLVLAESRAKDKRSDVRGDINEPSLETQSNNSRLKEGNANTDGSIKVVFPESKETTETATDVTMPATVNIENVDVFHDKKNKMLNVKFILKKTDGTAKTVSGRAFVLLKGNNGKIDPLVIPSVSLSPEGIPSQIKRGQYFSIANLKWMNFKKKFPSTTTPFKYLTIFIFSTEGNLLLEKEMAI